MDQMGEVEYAPGEPKGTPWHPHRGFETVTYIMHGTQLLFPLVRVNCALGVIMVIAVSCVKLLSAHNSTQHTSREHKV